MSETVREPLEPGFPQEIAWAVSALTFLTDENNWPAFYAYLSEDNGIIDEAGSEEMLHVAHMAAQKLYGIGHNMVERRKAMMELPPFLRQFMGIPVDESEMEDDAIEDEGTGNYL